jgi:hypothetical protein
MVFRGRVNALAGCHGGFSTWAQLKARACATSCPRLQLRGMPATGGGPAQAFAVTLRMSLTESAVHSECRVPRLCVRTSRQTLSALCFYQQCAHLQSGFIRGPAERRVLTPAALAARQTFSLTLCPYDRAECRDRLMTLTYMADPSTTVALGFRSMPFWEDVPIQDGAVDVTRAREALAGVSVVTGVDGGGGGAVERTLLDFNTLYGTYPDALPGGSLVRPRLPHIDVNAGCLTTR